MYSPNPVQAMPPSSPPLLSLLSQSTITPLPSTAELLAHILANPGECAPSNVTTERETPLHLALSLKLDYEIIVSVGKNSDLSALDAQNNLPLHTAMFNRHSIDTIRYLIDQHPAVLHQESLGTTNPLTFGGLTHQNVHGWLPLHYACGWGQATLETLLTVFHLHPDAARTGDGQGLLPIHWAVKHQTAYNVIELIKLDPAMTQIAAANGGLPLHHMFYSPTPAVTIAAVAALVDAHPPSLAMTDDEGLTAWDRAMTNDGELQFLEVLELIDPKGVLWEYNWDRDEWIYLGVEVCVSINRALSLGYDKAIVTHTVGALTNTITVSSEGGVMVEEGTGGERKVRRRVPYNGAQRQLPYRWQWRTDNKTVSKWADYFPNVNLKINEILASSDHDAITTRIDNVEYKITIDAASRGGDQMNTTTKTRRFVRLHPDQQKTFRHTPHLLLVGERVKANCDREGWRKDMTGTVAQQSHTTTSLSVDWDGGDSWTGGSTVFDTNEPEKDPNRFLDKIYNSTSSTAHATAHATDRVASLLELIVAGSFAEATSYLNYFAAAASQPAPDDPKLPLHYALAATPAAPLAFIEKLIKLCPDALTTHSSSGKLPLHYACMNQPHKTLKYVLNQNPTATTHADHLGFLPLHYLASSRHNPGSPRQSSLDLLINFNWAAVTTRTNAGQFPYDLAPLSSLKPPPPFNDDFHPLQEGADIYQSSRHPFGTVREVLPPHNTVFVVDWDDGTHTRYDFADPDHDPRVTGGLALRPTVVDPPGRRPSALSIETVSTTFDDFTFTGAPSVRAFSGNGGICSTPLGTQVSIPPSISNPPQHLSFVEVDTKLTNTLTSQSTIPIAVAAPVVQFDNSSTPPLTLPPNQFVTIRLPHNNGSNLTAWSENNGIWSRIDDAQVTANDRYANIQLDQIPNMVTATCDPERTVENVNVLAFASKNKGEVVVCCVPQRRDQVEACIEMLKSKDFMLADEGFDYLQLKRGDKVSVSVNADGAESVTKSYVNKRLSFTFPPNVLAAASDATAVTFVARADKDSDEVEVAVECYAFRTSFLPLLAPPVLASRSQQTTQVRCAAEPPPSKCVYRLQVCKLSLKDGPPFPPAAEMDESRWRDPDSTTADLQSVTLSGIYACYCRVKVLHKPTDTSGEWSDVLYIPPPSTRQRGIVDLTKSIGSSLDLANRDLVLFDDSVNSQDVDEEQLASLQAALDSATAGAKIYTQCCSTLCRKATFVIQHARKTNTPLAPPVLRQISATIELIEKCASAGWLSLLLLPPSPSWNSLFFDADEAITQALVAAGQLALSQKLSSHTALVDYLDDFSVDYNGLARDHFLICWCECGGDIFKLEQKIHDFCLDFNCGYNDFRAELFSDELKGVCTRVAAEAGDVAAGTPRRAVDMLRGNGKSTIFYSFVRKERSEEKADMEKFLASKGWRSVESSAGSGVVDGMHQAILSCSVFVAVVSASYGDRKTPTGRATLRELEMARRFNKAVVAVGGQGAMSWATKSVDEGSSINEVMRCLVDLKVMPNGEGGGGGEGGRGEEEETEELFEMDASASAWLTERGFGSLIDPLLFRGGVTSMGDIVKIAERSTWEDLEAVVCDKTVILRLVGKVNEWKKRERYGGKYGEDVIRACSGNEVLTDCYAKAAAVAERGEVTGKLTKDFLTILAPKVASLSKAKVGMVETYCGSISDVLGWMEEGLAEAEREKKEALGASMGGSMRRWLGRLKLGGSKSFSDKMEGWEKKVQDSIAQINCVLSM